MKMTAAVVRPADHNPGTSAVCKSENFERLALIIKKLSVLSAHQPQARNCLQASAALNAAAVWQSALTALPALLLAACSAVAAAM
jgi:hypothetical protein